MKSDLQKSGFQILTVPNSPFIFQNHFPDTREEASKLKTQNPTTAEAKKKVRVSRLDPKNETDKKKAKIFKTANPTTTVEKKKAQVSMRPGPKNETDKKKARVFMRPGPKNETSKKKAKISDDPNENASQAVTKEKIKAQAETEKETEANTSNLPNIEHESQAVTEEKKKTQAVLEKDNTISDPILQNEAVVEKTTKVSNLTTDIQTNGKTEDKPEVLNRNFEKKIRLTSHKRSEMSAKPQKVTVPFLKMTRRFLKVTHQILKCNQMSSDADLKTCGELKIAMTSLNTAMTIHISMTFLNTLMTSHKISKMLPKSLKCNLMSNNLGQNN